MKKSTKIQNFRCKVNNYITDYSILRLRTQPKSNEKYFRWHSRVIVSQKKKKTVQQNKTWKIM